MTLLKPSPLLEGEDVAQIDDKLLVLMKRLGVEAMPAHETLVLPIARLVVPGADLLRASQKLVRSIKRVGVLQSPAVVLLTGTSLADAEATFEVMFGRRRVLAAHLAGMVVLKCEVYASGTPQLSSLLALIENEQRSVAWIKEVQDLHRLIEEGVGMTIDELAEFGFDRGSLAERLKMAQLPPALLTAIFAGRVNQATAKRLCRLSPTQQQTIAQLAVAGEEITPDLVKQALRLQVNSGFVPLQEALAASMETEPGAAAMGTDSRGGEAQPLAPTDPRLSLAPALSNGAPITLAAMLATLRAFEGALLLSSSTETLRLLTRTLMQEVEVASRTATPIFKTQLEGASCHV